MSELLKRLTAFALCAALIFGQVAMGAEASWGEEVGVDTYTHINPLYADQITEDDLVNVPPVMYAAEAAEYATTIEDAAAVLREQMEDRAQSCVVYLRASKYSRDWSNQIFDAAVEHTGNPTEGDYLYWVYGGYRIKASYYMLDGYCYITYTYTMTYYTNAQQEAELDRAVAKLLDELNLYNASDYEKICGIYDYMCANIVYDYDNLKNENYKLQYTAYAAMINKTSVCQGYAVLLYRLALELGLDCRIVVGIGNGGGHAWNIIKIDNRYYCLDATWDAIWYQSGGYYGFFLKCEKNFTDHYPEEDWNAKGYNISKADYVTDVNHATLGHPMSDWSVSWDATCTENGSKIRYCKRTGCNFEETEIIPATGHNWKDATCDAAKICTVCGTTEGNANGHNFVADQCACGAVKINKNTFPDVNFRTYINAQYGSGGVLTSDVRSNVEYMDVSYMNIKNLTGIQYFNGLKMLSCGNNQLTSLDVSNCTALTELYCNDNQLKTLNVSNCTALWNLSCGNNQLADLDLSGCTALENLSCGYNQLRGLDVSRCAELVYLSCGNNQLTNLDVSDRAALATLYCEKNQLTNLNVDNCTALQSLLCDDNQLINLDVSDCISLESLHCFNNQLTSLNVTGCTRLKYLSCGWNALTSLDVSGCKALTDLYCYGNSRTVSAEKNRYDLSNLAVDGFDINKASNWRGGTVSGNILTAATNVVSYTYDLGNGETANFNLVLDGSCAHSWQSATCTAPKTCKLCGATDGSALGHSWKDATCIQAKTCSVCYVTEGNANGHSWTEATCTEPKSCIDCNASDGSALGHSWVDATCTEAKTCAACNVTEGVAKGHKWSEATCTEPKTCSVCKMTEGNAKGHSWTEATCTEPKTCKTCGEAEGTAKGHDLNEATCTEPKTCKVCGVTDGSALGHNWIDATCTEAKTCSVCKVTEGDANGHSWTEATCTEPKTCTVCNATEGDAKGHDWSNSSCTEAKTCKICGVTEGAAAGHSWMEATCTEPKTCKVCGVTNGSALGHNWIDATCTEAKTCSVCKVTEGDANGHSWTEATCTEPKTCTVCNATEGDAKGHDWSNSSCTEAKTCKTCGVTEGAAQGHDWNAATCTEAKTCKTCDVTEGTAAGHSWVDATCTEPKTCKVCGVTEGEKAHHVFDQEKAEPKYLVSEGVYYKSCKCGDAGTETFTVKDEKPVEFKDVPQNAYFYNPVMWAVQNKVTSGTGDGTTFEPNAVCTRGQVVTFLWRAAGQPEPETTVNPFVDVKISDYFYKAVLWALENKITTGTGDGTTFEPHANCNRGQIVTFLSRAKNGTPNAKDNPFVDVASNAYYYNPVLWAVENGITTGTGDGTTFEPNADCTRGQVITFLYRAYTK